MIHQPVTEHKGEMSVCLYLHVGVRTGIYLSVGFKL